ncbi:MAG: undecaprenyl/decaprenyl-phosphate alpha-N-acetylglucosaminyl 1-phosphate transferase [Bacteroidales bacterium]|nr:undecaprenyl/decaprenyl-phosphate alpha-N-acetylglucosaminyl 1-phosphate transferase [Bacteroidales bacterium]
MNLYFYLVAFIISLFTVPIIVYIARKKNILYQPNNRSSHSTPIPAFGGIAIFLGFSIGILFLNHFDLHQYWIILAAAAFIFTLGLIDDLIVIRSLKKLIILIAISIGVSFLDGLTITNLHGLFQIYEIPKYIGIPITALVVLVVINAINLIDGIDGLASGIGILNLGFYAYSFYMLDNFHFSSFNLIMVSSILAFLIYNLSGYRFKIFMGDSGSLLLGFIISISILRFLNIEGATIDGSIQVSVVTVFSLLIVPVFDLLYVSIKRASLGLKIYIPDKRHIHHTLLKLGFSHKLASLVLVMYTIVFFVIGQLLIAHLYCCIALGILLILAVILWTIPEYIINKNPRKYVLKRNGE